MSRTRTTRKASRRYDPSRDRKKLYELQREFSQILSCLCEPGPAVRGKVSLLRRRCGKENCRCARGELHVAWVFLEQSSGCRRLRTVSPEERRALRKPTQRYHALRRLRSRLGKLCREALACGDRLRLAQLAEGARVLERMRG